MPASIPSILRAASLAAFAFVAACEVTVDPGAGPGTSPAPPIAPPPESGLNPTERATGARLVGSALCADRGGGGFLTDPNGTCYQCPSGTIRNLEPVSSPRACTQVTNPLNARPARTAGRAGCQSDQFALGTSCYACPAGTRPLPGVTQCE